MAKITFHFICTIRTKIDTIRNVHAEGYKVAFPSAAYTALVDQGYQTMDTVMKENSSSSSSSSSSSTESVPIIRAKSFPRQMTSAVPLNLDNFGPYAPGTEYTKERLLQRLKHLPISVPHFVHAKDYNITSFADDEGNASMFLTDKKMFKMHHLKMVIKLPIPLNQVANETKHGLKWLESYKEDFRIESNLYKMLSNYSPAHFPWLIAFSEGPVFPILITEMGGMSLNKYIKKAQNNQDMKDVLTHNTESILRSMIDATEMFHTSEYAHLDIKLSNFVLQPDSFSKVWMIDFGLAARFGTEFKSNSKITLTFRPPENMLGWETFEKNFEKIKQGVQNSQTISKAIKDPIMNADDVKNLQQTFLSKAYILGDALGFMTKNKAEASADLWSLGICMAGVILQKTEHDLYQMLAYHQNTLNFGRALNNNVQSSQISIDPVYKKIVQNLLQEDAGERSVILTT